MNILILFTHWVADFVLQTRWMADNKSKRWDALGLHVGVYTLTFLLVMLFCANWLIALQFCAINGALHFLTDAITSRVTSYFWKEKKVAAFFMVIGFDQFIHSSTLLLTASWFLEVHP